MTLDPSSLIPFIKAVLFNKGQATSAVPACVNFKQCVLSLLIINCPDGPDVLKPAPSGISHALPYDDTHHLPLNLTLTP